MATPSKKREILSADTNEIRVSSGDDDDINLENLMLQVDFEGFNPSISDYHGIKVLLRQLFLKAHIDLSELTNMIISQHYIGSIIKQAVDTDDENDDDDDVVNQVFGITTVVNITSKQDVSCIQQFKNILQQLADKYATDTANAMIKSVLENDAHVGLIINERFVNIPAKVSVPLMANLITEIKRANNKKLPFNFSYYLLVCKLHKSQDKKVKGKLKSKDKNTDEEPSLLWSNEEEEIFAEEAIANFEFCIDEDADNALIGKWTEADCEMIPYRRVLLLEASKLEIIFTKIQNRFS